MLRLGIREIVGLAALAAALVVGFLFLDPASSESNGDGTPLSAPTDGWTLQFFETSATGDIGNGGGPVPTLDLDFKGQPFPDFKDGQWYVVASAELAVKVGRNALTIQHDCDLKVLIDGREVLHDPDPPSAKTSTVSFSASAEKSHILVQCRDAAGPFLLKFGE